jgi:hypothetical protein
MLRSSVLNSPVKVLISKALTGVLSTQLLNIR